MLLLIISCGNTQIENPLDEPIVINELSEYYIECSMEDFNKMYENYKSNDYISIKISFEGTSLCAKMRVRGDTSREDKKKSLKIKFDSTAFSSIEPVFNLNAEYSDKTAIRQFISSKLMQKSGQICFNSELVKVYLNGEYFGIYLKVENIDENFLKRNNLSKKNNLYKATKDGACLSIFDDINTKWEKKTNKKSDNNDLVALIKNLNIVPNEEFHSFIKENFEYDNLINIIALNMMLSNGSTYYHNYYLYRDLYKTGKWQLLPWDMDKSLSYYNWAPYTYHKTSSEWESDNPLIERAILCSPIFNDIKKRIDELHKTYLNNSYVTPIIDQLITVLTPIIEKDSTDKITTKNEWLKTISQEKQYFDNHYKLLQKQFNEQPSSFYVQRFQQTQTDSIIFQWGKSTHKQNKPITYVLSYGTDFLLLDSTKTTYITNITDTFYRLNNKLAEGKYYWKITAFDGSFYTDGYNTKNILEVKKGTLISGKISSNQTLLKINSPYIISKDVVIANGVILTIEPGVQIYLKDNVKINCNGSIVSEGTAKEPIVFCPDNTANNWDYIYFYENSKKGVFKYTNFLEGSINFKGTDLSFYNCNFKIDKKDLVDGERRAAIVWGHRGKLTISNSSFESNGKGEGVVLYYVDALVENSTFDNMPDAIEYISTNTGIIRNNLIINAPDDAIDLNDCKNVTIEKNIIVNAVDKAISIGTEQFGPSKNILVNNNLIINCKTAISVKDSSDAIVKNNTLYKNKKGINSYRKRSDYGMGGIVNVDYTILDQCVDFNVYADEWSKIKIDHSIATKKSLGSTNIVGDPQFIFPENYDFHLKEKSPCILNDKNGEYIGAFHYNASSLSLVGVHLAISNEKNAVCWIEIQNNYNIEVNLSGYEIVVETGDKKKKFVFPIGTKIPRLSSLFIVNNFGVFANKNVSSVIVGDLPKLNNKDTRIKLINSKNYLIDEFSYKQVEINNTQNNITYFSNRVNNKTFRKWEFKFD